jgi:hypothetical protein
MITNDELKRIASGEARFFPSTGRDMATELLALREQTRWRKYPEEKPEENQVCNVTEVFQNDKSRVSTEIYNEDCPASWMWVIAWQPRPEPYRPSAPDAKGG